MHCFNFPTVRAERQSVWQQRTCQGHQHRVQTKMNAKVIFLREEARQSWQMTQYLDNEGSFQSVTNYPEYHDEETRPSLLEGKREIVCVGYFHAILKLQHCENILGR